MGATRRWVGGCLRRVCACGYAIVQNANFYMYLHTVHKHFFMPHRENFQIFSATFECVLRTKFDRKIT